MRTISLPSSWQMMMRKNFSNLLSKPFYAPFLPFLPTDRALCLGICTLTEDDRQGMTGYIKITLLKTQRILQKSLDGGIECTGLFSSVLLRLSKAMTITLSK